jgi:hypothetical protein
MLLAARPRAHSSPYEDIDQTRCGAEAEQGLLIVLNEADSPQEFARAGNVLLVFAPIDFRLIDMTKHHFPRSVKDRQQHKISYFAFHVLVYDHVTSPASAMVLNTTIYKIGFLGAHSPEAIFVHR